jgi:hypothetical protein
MMTFGTPPDESEPSDTRICVGGVPAPDAQRQCRMYIGFDEASLQSDETLRDCDLPFLEPADDSTPGVADFARATNVKHVCRVKQIDTEHGPEEQGWYYAVDSKYDPLTCLNVTAGLPRSEDISVWVTCPRTQAITRDGELVESDPGLCSLPADSARHAREVGQACTVTTVPDGGFADSTIHVETNSPDCDTGACLVYKLQGDPDCKPAGSDKLCDDGTRPPTFAPSASETNKRMYCSCRCDAPEGDPGDLCTCDAGYSCVPTLHDGPPGVRGSYCVKNGTFSTF